MMAVSRNRRVGPLAPHVAGERDEFGPYCRDCGGAVYVAKITGRRGDATVTYRHVSLYPACDRLVRP